MDENPTPNQMMDATTLSSHVFQLATAGLVYMGAAKLPGTEQVVVILPLAKLTIDTLDMPSGPS